MDFTKNVALQLLQSSDPFPVDFDAAIDWWQARTRTGRPVAKGDLKEKLESNFIQGVDFWIPCPEGDSNFSEISEKSQAGRPRAVIRLTIECFKMMGMMISGERGNQIRRYFLDCEAELKRIIEQDGFGHANIEDVYNQWLQRRDLRVYLKDFLRVELMEAVVCWAVDNGVSPIKLASQVHDLMNTRIQGVTSQEIKQKHGMTMSQLIRDHFGTEPLTLYVAINKLSRNYIVDRGMHPLDSVHEACDIYLSKSYVPKPVPILENLYSQGTRIKAARKRRRLAAGQQLDLFGQAS